MSPVNRPCPTQQWPHTFPVPLLTVKHSLKPFLLPLTSFSWFIPSWALAFLTASWTVLPHSSHITCPQSHPLFTSLLCPSIARSSWLIHAGFLVFLLHFLLMGMDCSWSQKKWSLTINHLSQIPLPSRDPIPWDSFKQIPEEDLSLQISFMVIPLNITECNSLIFWFCPSEILLSSRSHYLIPHSSFGI